MKIENKALFIVLPVILLCQGFADAQTIVTHETEKYFYQDGRMEKFDGQYENTYLLDAEQEKLTRTRVYDYQKKEVRPDNTVYAIDTLMDSHPRQASKHNLPPVITAVGKPSDNSAEVLVIRADSVESSMAEGDRLIVSRAERLS